MTEEQRAAAIALLKASDVTISAAEVDRLLADPQFAPRLLELVEGAKAAAQQAAADARRAEQDAYAARLGISPAKAEQMRERTAAIDAQRPPDERPAMTLDQLARKMGYTPNQWAQAQTRAAKNTGEQS